MSSMNPHTVSRRGFLGLAGAASVFAGLGLAGCGGKEEGAGSAPVALDVEPANGTPANTPLDQIPMPEVGGVYNNPKKRDEVKDGGELVLSIGEVGPCWNYYNVNGGTTYIQTMWNLYMPMLMDSDATGSKFTPNPNYVESFEVDDSTGKQVVKITMNPDAVFNDGTPIDYRAFETVWKCCCGENDAYACASTDGFNQVESIVQGEKANDVVITMAKPYYPAEGLWSTVLHPASLDPEVFNNGWNNNPHVEWGAGPFEIESFDDTHAVFVPNKAWWGDAPKLEKVTFKQMEAQAIINAFKNGEIDATDVTTGSAEILSNFLDMEDAEIRRGYSSAIACIEINTTRESTQDVAVRKAFAQCLHMPTIVEIVYKGVNWEEKPCGSIILPPWMDGYENNMPEDVQKLKDAKEHTEAARKTLEDAGYTLNGDYYEKDGKVAGFGFVLFGDSTTVKNRAAAFQKMAKDAGIKLDLITKASADFSKTISSGEWDSLLLGWNGTPTSFNNGGQLYGSESESNFTQYGSAEIDEMMAEVPTVSDHKKQLKLVNEAEKLAMEGCAIIPIFCGSDVIAAKKGLANYGPALFLSVHAEDMGWAK